MLSITHTLISIPFGIYLESPLAIFACAVVMHFLADTLLHWNIYPADFSKRMFVLLAALDVTGGLLLAWVLLGQEVFQFPILLAIAAGNLPDVVHSVLEIAPVRWQKIPVIQKFLKWHDGLQLETTRIGKGLVWQVILIAGALALLT